MSSGISQELVKTIERLKINTLKKHIFLCAGEKCCRTEDGMKSWNFLKERTNAQDCQSLGVYRTKVSCLRICREGPVALVYPDGVWYRNVTPEVCARIVDEHIIGGKSVKEHIIIERPLR